MRATERDGVAVRVFLRRDGEEERDGEEDENREGREYRERRREVRNEHRTGRLRTRLVESA